jgi:formiminotetrahydrofolate cyclodeaminase
MTNVPLVEERFSTLLDGFAGDGPALGGGSGAALVGAVAAALVERCARASRQQSMIDAAAGLRDVLARAADQDAAAFADLREAVRASERLGDERVVAAATAASDAPALVLDAAARVAALARTLEAEGPSRWRGEARCAVLFADAACQASHEIVALNAKIAEPDDTA